MYFRCVLSCIATIALSFLVVSPTPAQTRTSGPPRKKTASIRPAVKPPVKSTPKPPPREPGFPQDAGPHDRTASIEWWYFNSFLKTDTGRNIAVVGSFFRTGLSATKKGHYLIYSLADLDNKTKMAYSILDNANIALLHALLPVAISARPEDPRPYQLLRTLQQGKLPAPHQKLGSTAVVKSKPEFSITFDNNWLIQAEPDGRTWTAQLTGIDEMTEQPWTLELTMKQPTRPPMLVGGKGMTGVKRPDEMYYLSLTRMQVTGTLTIDGVVEKVNGDGWLDRQWGSPEFVASYGWDWFGLQMDNGDDLLLARIRDVNTGKVVKYEATLLTKEGTTVLEKPVLKAIGDAWQDPETGIAFPVRFEVTLPESGYTLTIAPVFPEQTIPVIGVGDAIWEGAVSVEGTNREGTLVTGRGYMELVGYRAVRGAKPTKPPEPPAPKPADEPAPTPDATPEQ